MKKTILLLLIGFMVYNCNNSSENKHQKTVEAKHIPEITEQQIMNTESETKINLPEIFYQKEVENGSLLGTTDGKLNAQYQRAMIFIPTGGGNSDSANYKLIESNEQYIKIRNAETELEIALFQNNDPGDAVIVKKETGVGVNFLKYSVKSNSLSVPETNNIIPEEHIKLLETITFEKNGLKLGNGEFLLWKGNVFTKE